MTEPAQVACALNATDLGERREELRALGAAGLVDATEEPGRAVLRFRPDAAIRRRVEAIVAAESECCAFLDFRLDHREEISVLTISAPGDGAEMVHELAAALAGR